MKGGSTSSKAGAAKQLEALAVDASTDGPLLVTALAALGAQQKALALAAARIEQGGPPALRVLFEPPLAPARQSPQFAQLAQRFGLVSYWRQSRNLPDFCKKASPPALCASL